MVPDLNVFPAVMEERVLRQGERRLVVDEEFRPCGFLVQHLAKQPRQLDALTRSGSGSHVLGLARGERHHPLLL